VSEPPCLREFNVVVVSAREAFGDSNGLVYNSRGAQTTVIPTSGSSAPNPTFGNNPLYDPDALVYVLADSNGKPLPPKNPEPLVLRANAGDWIKIKLTNHFHSTDPVFNTDQKVARVDQYTSGYNQFPVKTSTSVGLHPQLVGFDVTRANGLNAGLNLVQTAAPGEPVEYLWYAGDLQYVDGKWIAEPMELGAINLDALRSAVSCLSRPVRFACDRAERIDLASGYGLSSIGNGISRQWHTVPRVRVDGAGRYQHARQQQFILQIRRG